MKKSDALDVLMCALGGLGFGMLIGVGVADTMDYAIAMIVGAVYGLFIGYYTARYRRQTHD